MDVFSSTRNRVFGRVEVQADDISDLGREFRILTHFVSGFMPWARKTSESRS